MIPFFSQSPNLVGSGPSLPPSSFGKISVFFSVFLIFASLTLLPLITFEVINISISLGKIREELTNNFRIKNYLLFSLLDFIFAS